MHMLTKTAGLICSALLATVAAPADAAPRPRIDLRGDGVGPGGDANWSGP